MCPWRVFWVYKTVADSGEVVIEGQGFSIFDTREPAIAISLPQFCVHTIDSPHRNQIFPVGCRQKVRRFVSAGLHHVTVGQ